MPSRNSDNSGPVQAGIYTRMSLVVMNDKTKVEDQELISRDLARNRGWEVADVYCDNSRSAWQKKRKRPAWDQMLADVEAGKITAIIVYHGDRLVRQPYDLETLLNLADAKGIQLASPTGTRDLDDASDRFVLRILTAQACMESDNTSRRRKSQYERWRREGRVRPGGRGGRAYGFSTDGATLIKDECEIIREMAQRVLRGETVGKIARDVSARGARTPAGGEFSHGTVRKMLARPRYAGLMPDGVSAAAWEPVLDRETWERVCVALEAKAAGYGNATNARKWLLSGIARCQCGEPLQVNPSKGRGGADYVTGYACRTGCRKTYRSAVHLDAYVSAIVVARLGLEDNPRPEMPAPDHAPEWAALTRERAETEALLGNYRASAGRAPMLMRRLDAIDARMAELREVADTSSRDRLITQYRGISLEEFRGLPLDVRRAVVAATVTVTVLPASKRGPGFRTEDVHVVPVQ
jgi:DNA invertase Pin-like site-specific DNA recombinase